MPIIIDTDPEQDLTIFKATGTLEFNELLSVVKHFYAGKPTLNVLLDLTEVPSVQITTDEIRELAGFKPRFESKRPPGKTAILGTSDLVFGLARMFETQSEIMDVPHAVRVFKKLAMAMSWLDSS